MSEERDSPDLQKAKTFFEYGNDAALKGNFDYAIDDVQAGLQDRPGESGLPAGAAGDRAAQVQ